MYFFAKHFVLRAEAAGAGLLLVPGLEWLAGSTLLRVLAAAADTVVPIAWLSLFALKLLNGHLQARGREPLVRLRHANLLLIVGGLIYGLSLIGPSVFTLNPALAGPGPYYLPGFAWLYLVVPKYFTNLYGIYYLAYFSAIAGFGLYWAQRSGHPLIWRRNLTIIASQWTLWWGIPTLLAVLLGRNVWTPLISRSLNAWPLNMGAFRLAPLVSSGDPAWWHTIALIGIAWAAILTFIVIPLVTIRWGRFTVLISAHAARWQKPSAMVIDIAVPRVICRGSWSE